MYGRSRLDVCRSVLVNKYPSSIRGTSCPCPCMSRYSPKPNSLEIVSFAASMKPWYSDQAFSAKELPWAASTIARLASNFGLASRSRTIWGACPVSSRKIDRIVVVNGNVFVSEPRSAPNGKKSKTLSPWLKNWQCFRYLKSDVLMGRYWQRGWEPKEPFHCSLR